MTTLADGGPAFPATKPKVLGSCGQCLEDARLVPGMSLRDWFAGMALTGWIAASSVQPEGEGCAAYCYEVADAMLAERAKLVGG